MTGPRTTKFIKRPSRTAKSRWVWDGATALNGTAPEWLLMIPCSTRFKGKTTKTTKWIFPIAHEETVEIDGPARKVYERLIEMWRENQ
tara:strand:- start:91 stop:354 length:264 start_codon:yes stop_codon:yes gene_type:complete